MGAGVGHGMNQALGLTDAAGKATSNYQGYQSMDRIARAALSGFAAGTATTLARGGRVAVTQIATDAFGNALGKTFGGELAAQAEFDRISTQFDAMQAAARKGMAFRTDMNGNVSTFNQADSPKSAADQRRAIYERLMTATAQAEAGERQAAAGAARAHGPAELNNVDAQALIEDIQRRTAPQPESGLQQVGLPPRGSRSEEVVKAQLAKLANNLEGYFDGADGANKKSKDQITANIEARAGAVQDYLTSVYGDSHEQIGMMKNAFVLMSYDALNRYNPDFQWTKLGIFAANEVRSGLATAYTAKETLALFAAMKPGGAVGGVALETAAQAAGVATHELLQGQLNVLSDIGALALMSKRYTPEVMANQGWLSREARGAFDLQAQAETAKANGDMVAFKSLQTKAAIEFGVHEQTYLLQPMWDKPMMKTFAKVNDWLLDKSGERLSLRGDIFVGVNKYERADRSNSVTIRAPWGNTDLSNKDQRIDIARNGFEQLQRIQADPRLAPTVDAAQARLGTGQGIYQPAALRRMSGL